jgi:transcriptional regulator with XRE-family HTH domain
MHSLRPVFFILYSRRKVIVLNIRQLSNDVQYVSDRCREFRKHAGKSQYDLSELTGMSYNTISRIETEQRIPDIEQIFRYCYALNIPVTDFLPPDIQCIGSPRQAQSLQIAYSQLTEANKSLVLSTLGVLIDGLLAQQDAKS